MPGSGEWVSLVSRTCKLSVCVLTHMPYWHSAEQIASEITLFVQIILSCYSSKELHKHELSVIDAEVSR